ncbi:hypothetical protein INQ30_25945, partial [Escherichia coli]|nr:hypothetical protein [Escherichia coli]
HLQSVEVGAGQHLAATRGRENEVRVQGEYHVPPGAKLHRPNRLDALCQGRDHPYRPNGSEDLQLPRQGRDERLIALGDAVKTVWNYFNEISMRSAQRGPIW